MNKAQRIKAAERIQTAHNADFGNYEAHINRAELLTLLADAERENEKLRGYTIHTIDCTANFEEKGGCICGLDETLNNRESE